MLATPAPTDATAVLSPGVYVLRSGGRPVWVGMAQPSMITRLYAHRTQLRGEPAKLPGMPRVPVKFDEVLLHPCRPDELRARYTLVCTNEGWQP